MCSKKCLECDACIKDIEERIKDPEQKRRVWQWELQLIGMRGVKID